jgi:hypothetical protein
MLSPAELFASSKKKFELALSRLRRDQIALALLSLQGSLEDGFRAHLALHQNPAAEGDFATLLQALYEDESEPLNRYEADRIRHTMQLQTRIATGEAVTLTKESMVAYRDFTAAMIRRYGVAIALSAEPVDFAMRLPSEESHEQELLDRIPRVDQRSPFWDTIKPITLLGMVVVCILASSITALLLRYNQFHAPSSVPTVTTEREPILPGATTILGTPTPRPPVSPTPLPRGVLRPGAIALVREEVVGGLALRAEPSTNEGIPVQVYLLPGTQVEVLEGPVEADGYTWWQVRSVEGQGWCAGEFLAVLRE